MRPSALACAHNPLQNHSLFSCIPAFIYIYFAIIFFSSALCVRRITLLVLIAVCLDVCVLFFLSIVVSGDSPLFRKDYKIAPRNDIFDGFCPVTACVAQVYRCWCYAHIRQHVNGMYTYSCFFLRRFGVRELLPGSWNLSSWHYYLWNWTKNHSLF